MRFLRRHRRRTEPRDPRTVRAALDFGASSARAVVARLLPDHVEVLALGEATGRSAVAQPGYAMRRDQIAALVERALTAAELSSAREGELPWVADDAIVGLTGAHLHAHSYVEHLPRPDPVAPVYEAEVRRALTTVQQRALKEADEAGTEQKFRRALVGSALVGAASLRADTRHAERLPEVTRGIPGAAGDYLAIALCNLTWPAKGLEVLGRVMDDVELRLTATVPIAQAVAAALPRSDAILLDVGYEHTELALVEGGALSALRTVPVGGAHFTRALMASLSMGEKHAELVKRHHSLGRAATRRGPVPRVLAAEATRWLRAVAAMLEELSADVALPPRFYLFGGGSLLSELLDSVRRYPWANHLLFTEAPTVEWLYPSHLRGLSDPRAVLGSPAYVGIAALAAWAAHEPSPLQRELSRLTPGFAARTESLSTFDFSGR